MEEQQTTQQNMQEQPKSRVWIWTLVLILLAIGGVVAWFLLSGDSSTGSILNFVKNVGSSIPQPPALPE